MNSKDDEHFIELLQDAHQALSALTRHEDECRQRAAWHATVGEQRQRLILEALGDDRLTLVEIEDRLIGAHRRHFGQHIRGGLITELNKMLQAQELLREQVTRGQFKVKLCVYYRAPMSPELLDLQRRLTEE